MKATIDTIAMTVIYGNELIFLSNYLVLSALVLPIYQHFWGAFWGLWLLFLAVIRVNVNNNQTITEVPVTAMITECLSLLAQ